MRRARTLFSSRHVLSGSYNNYFHIYDKNAETDTVLQADKSAFKAKKIGANKQKPGQGKGLKNNGKPVIDVDSIDFNKKILHGESCQATNLRQTSDIHVCLPLKQLHGTLEKARSQLLRPTICSCTLSPALKVKPVDRLEQARQLSIIDSLTLSFNLRLLQVWHLAILEPILSRTVCLPLLTLSCFPRFHHITCP